MVECNWENCGIAVPDGSRLIDGKSYCPDHYERLLTRRFHSVYNEWIEEGLPNDFLNSWSRYVVEVVYHGQALPGMLSKARLRDRTFNHKKGEDGLTFSIIRHPGAFKHGVVTKEIQQNWIFKIDTGELILNDEK